MGYEIEMEEALVVLNNAVALMESSRKAETNVQLQAMIAGVLKVGIDQAQVFHRSIVARGLEDVPEAQKLKRWIKAAEDARQVFLAKCVAPAAPKAVESDPEMGDWDAVDG